MDLQVEDERDGSMDKYKTRHVIKGFRLKEGIYYFHIYSSITRITYVRMIIAITTFARFGDTPNGC